MKHQQQGYPPSSGITGVLILTGNLNLSDVSIKANSASPAIPLNISVKGCKNKKV